MTVHDRQKLLVLKVPKASSNLILTKKTEPMKQLSKSNVACVC